MSRIHKVVVLGLVLPFAGCKAILPGTLLSKSEQVQPAQVTVNRFLEQKRTLQIPESATLAQTLRRSESLDAELVKAVLRKNASLQKNPSLEKRLDDNCVLLRRGNDVWCFIEKMDLARLSSQIRVNSGDSISTRPLRSVIERQKDNQKDDIKVGVVGIGTSNQKIESIGKGTVRQFFEILNENSTVWKTNNLFNLAVVNRKKGNLTIHLVLPKVKDRNEIVGFFLEDGDLIEFTNAAVFLRRFR